MRQTKMIKVPPRIDCIQNANFICGTVRCTRFHLKSRPHRFKRYFFCFRLENAYNFRGQKRVFDPSPLPCTFHT